MAHNEEIKEAKAGLVANIIGSIAFLAAGICLLVLDANIIAKVVYSFSIMTFGILFICFGAYYMIKYFFNREYTRITSYGFTMGVILVIIGAVFIFKASMISSFIDALVCLIGLVFGAVMLQQSFALFHIKKITWFFSLVFGAVTIASSIYLLINPIKVFEGNLYTIVYLIVVGALSLLSLLFMGIGLRSHRKNSTINYNRNLEDEPIASDKANEAFFEEEPAVEIKEEVKQEPETGSDAMFEE